MNSTLPLLSLPLSSTYPPSPPFPDSLSRSFDTSSFPSSELSADRSGNGPTGESSPTLDDFYAGYNVELDLDHGDGYSGVPGVGSGSGGGSRLNGESKNALVFPFPTPPASSSHSNNSDSMFSMQHTLPYPRHSGQNSHSHSHSPYPDPRLTSHQSQSYPSLVHPDFTNTSFSHPQSAHESHHRSDYRMSVGEGNSTAGSRNPSPPHHDPSRFLDLDLSQPGPSTYHHQSRLSHSHEHLNNGNNHTTYSHGQLYNSNNGISDRSGVDRAVGSREGSHGVYSDRHAGPDGTAEFLNAELDDGNMPSGLDSEQDVDDDEELNEVKQDEDAQTGDGEGVEGNEDNEEPLYVNAKQYHRILKRRMARARLEELNRLVRSRKPYLHESRHRHACSRPRGKGGRFLTAEEIEALKKEEGEKISNAAV